MRPVLIGHSQGGMLAIRVLYDLAGVDSIPV
jgi:predicted esterase